MSHPHGSSGQAHPLRLRRLGIDTCQEAVVYTNRECRVCRSEGFSAQSRVLLRAKRAAGAARIASRNTLRHRSNAIAVDDLISMSIAGAPSEGSRVVAYRDSGA